MTTQFDPDSPPSVIELATRAHPAFRYGLAVLGLFGIVASVSRYGVSYAALVFGIVVILLLMTVFLVFATAAAMPKRHLATPAAVLVWASLAIVILVAGCLFSSTFFNEPLPFRAYIVEHLKPPPAATPPPVIQTPSSTQAESDAPVQSSKLPNSDVPASRPQSEIQLVIRLTWDQGREGATPAISIPRSYTCGDWRVLPESNHPELFQKEKECMKSISASGSDSLVFQAIRGEVYVEVFKYLDKTLLGIASLRWLSAGTSKEVRVPYTLR
jgi:hypothetical protein